MWRSSFQIVQYLIEKGVNIEAKDKDQETPFHIASRIGRTDVVKYSFSKYFYLLQIKQFPKILEYHVY